MSSFLTLFRKALRRKIVLELALLGIVGLVGGGSVLWLSPHSANAALACSSQSVRPGSMTGYTAAIHTSNENALAQTNRIPDIESILPNQEPCLPKPDLRAASMAMKLAPTPTVIPVTNSPTPIGSPPTGGSTVAAMIEQVFGSYAQGALNVARCESGLNANAYNPSSNGGSHAEGVFQILYPSTWSRTPQAASSPFNAMANIQAAHWIFVRDGYSWREWSCQP